ncbi:MAG: WecB/TagA/CpsF family glycosyltransferase [Parvularculaceae bacterium]
MTAASNRNEAESKPPVEARRESVAPLPRDDFDRDVWCVLGLPIDMLNVREATVAVEAAARDRRRLSLVTPNVNWLVRALKDQSARREILNADLSLADGAPVVAIARLLGAPITSRATGADLFAALRAKPAMAGRRLRVFFFGGREGAAEAAAAARDAHRGGLEAAGAFNPGYGDLQSMSGTEVIEAVNAARPDFVIVALGAAKGQAWIELNRMKLTAPVVAHLGAVVDFVAGTKARAPLWLRRFGLEWVWRIREEPTLIQRYWKDGIALAGLSMTRLFPQIFAGRLDLPRSAPGAAVDRVNGKVTIRLSGDLGGDLSAIRVAFREAAAADEDVVLDLQAARRVDRAFLGLVLMLEKHVRGRARALATRGLTAPQRALFKANAMNYPAADMARESINVERKSAPAA